MQYPCSLSLIRAKAERCATKRTCDIVLSGAFSPRGRFSFADGNVSCGFDRYVGVDYSGAETAGSSLKGLRVYLADHSGEPHEAAPPPGLQKYWTRQAVAEWLVDRLCESPRTLAGIDHGFSFPLQYFEKYTLAHDWPAFLDDFQKHWPTDEDNTYVDFVRDGLCGNAAARCGDSRWRRITEARAGAKSVFHFDVPGSVAKSTHAGIPWLRFLRRRAGDRVHFWPFNGWIVPPGKSVVVEVYPALWSHSFPRDGRNSDQQDAYAATEWLRRNDLQGSLEQFFSPSLTEHEREVAESEGWKGSVGSGWPLDSRSFVKSTILHPRGSSTSHAKQGVQLFPTAENFPGRSCRCVDEGRIEHHCL